MLFGFGGAVNGIGSIRKWSISEKADLVKLAASNTSGGEGADAGNKDWSGSYDAFGHTPDVWVGEAISFAGSIDGTNGCSGAAIVDKIEIKINIESGEYISHTVSFSGNGALTKGAVAATDATVLGNYSSIGCKVELGTLVAEPVFTELPNVKTITLSFSANNNSYVDSGTAGLVKRTAGNITCTVAIDMNVNALTDIVAVNTVKVLKVFVDATHFWLIKWVIFGEASGIEGNIETKAVVSCTLNATLKVAETIGSTRTIGEITDPADATLWPAS